MGRTYYEVYTERSSRSCNGVAALAAPWQKIRHQEAQPSCNGRRYQKRTKIIKFYMKAEDEEKKSMDNWQLPSAVIATNC